jgi:hypothetical protein
VKACAGAAVAFVVTAEAVLIEGVFYGGRDFEAILRDRE